MFTEFNNRQIANQYAEFITSPELRKFVATKVARYCGDAPISVFDGACGSGQLEQFVNVRRLYGIDIQPQPLENLPRNFPDASVTTVCSNFFDVIEEVHERFDCVIMNPPFSLKFTNETEATQQKIASLMPYTKKGGVLDEAFYVLASQKARFSFFVCFPGVGYRKSEQKMREWFGVRIAEIVEVANAFTDTQVSVLLVIVDNEKTTRDVVVSFLDCRGSNTPERIAREDITTDVWNRPPPVQQKSEPIDIVAITRELAAIQARRRALENEWDALVRSMMSSEELGAI